MLSGIRPERLNGLPTVSLHHLLDPERRAAFLQTFTNMVRATRAAAE